MGKPSIPGRPGGGGGSSSGGGAGVSLGALGGGTPKAGGGIAQMDLAAAVSSILPSSLRLTSTDDLTLRSALVTAQETDWTTHRGLEISRTDDELDFVWF